MRNVANFSVKFTFLNDKLAKTMARLLIIDNQDSFTYNLVDLVRRVSAETALEFDVVNVHELELNAVENYSHILISPGPDVPSAYPQLFAMLERYYQHKSILGVCLGHQTLCQFFGGQLYNLSAPRHGQQRDLKVRSNSGLFLNLPAQFHIGLYHSWAVSEQGFPEQLEITATCDQKVIMAMQHKTLPIFSVQFHPESYMSEFGAQILRNWLNYQA